MELEPIGMNGLNRIYPIGSNLWLELKMIFLGIVIPPSVVSNGPTLTVYVHFTAGFEPEVKSLRWLKPEGRFLVKNTPRSRLTCSCKFKRIFFRE